MTSEDDVLADLFGQLDFEEPTDVDDLSKLTLPELQDRLTEYDEFLKVHGEVLTGKYAGSTQEVRDVHARRGAVIVEMRRRGW